MSTKPQFTNIIQPRSTWFDFKLRELWNSRDLIELLVRRDFVAVYKQTILGPFWHLIQPLITTLTFTFVFGRLARISTDGLPPILFYMAGTILWTFFSKSMVSTSNTFITHAMIFEKVYFPRLAIPIAIVISNLIAFGIQFGFFLLFYIFYILKGYPVHPTFALIYLPLYIFLIAMFSLGVGIIVSAMTTRYRDLKFLVEFGVGLLMYATPIIYPLSTIPEKYRWIVLLNPLSAVVESFRFSFLGTGMFRYDYLAMSAMAILFILFIGALIFNRVEKNFVDTV